MPPSKPVIRHIRSVIPKPQGLTSRNKLIYEDNAGNRLFAKKCPHPNCSVQWSAKNAENRLVNHQGTMTLMRRWNRGKR